MCSACRGDYEDPHRLPSGADLDAIAEEARVREATAEEQPYQGPKLASVWIGVLIFCLGFWLSVGHWLFPILQKLF